MIPEISITQMTEVDRLMIEEYNISLFQMMENAGRLLAKLAIELFKPKTVTILVGKGNNGGGGLVAARYLHNGGIKVKIVLADDNLKEAPKHHLETAKKLNIPITEIEESDLFIDALLGYNAKGEPRGKYKEIIDKVNSLNANILSLDIPTGFDLETGDFYDTSFQNAVVLTLGMPKTNMSKIKLLYIGDIGIPKEIYKEIGVNPVQFNEKDIIKNH